LRFGVVSVRWYTGRGTLSPSDQFTLQPLHYASQYSRYSCTISAVDISKTCDTYFGGKGYNLSCFA
jgi:hypothetical protein